MNILNLYSNEIKYRLMYIFISFLFCLLISFQYSDALFYLFVKPFLLVDANRSFLFTDLREGFQTTFKLIFFISFLFVLPYSWYLFWTFWKPSLYNFEINYPYFFFWLSWFNLCTLITYKYLLQFLWKFFLGFEFSSGLVHIYLEATIQSYFNFTFQIWACVLLFLVLPFFLKSYGSLRPFVWFASILLISFICPPDVLIQTLLTLGLFIFFEIVFLFEILRTKYIQNA